MSALVSSHKLFRPHRDLVLPPVQIASLMRAEMACPFLTLAETRQGQSLVEDVQKLKD